MAKKNINWRLLPLLGISCFVILYCVAASFYPGGSQVNAASTGFSWVNNYWCNLLQKTAINGQPNASRTMAFAAMAVLACSLVILWLLLPQLFEKQNKLYRVIPITGIASTFIFVFLFTRWHNEVINLGGMLGMIAMLLVLVGLYRGKNQTLFYWGCCCIILAMLNYYISFQANLLLYLPVIQKITFLVYLLWFCSIDFAIWQKATSKNELSNVAGNSNYH